MISTKVQTDVLKADTEMLKAQIANPMLAATRTKMVEMVTEKMMEMVTEKTMEMVTEKTTPKFFLNLILK